MEYTQWADKESSFAVAKQSLNPCCNGIYSMRLLGAMFGFSNSVLILVVMEYTQWV